MMILMSVTLQKHAFLLKNEKLTTEAMERFHDSVLSKFVCGGSKQLDLKPYILLNAKFKEQSMIATGLSLTG